MRETSEKELILCNLLARRQAMLELGGFNEALYPNEENALMDELQKRGGKLLYDPELLVHRRPRSSLKSFARMLHDLRTRPGGAVPRAPDLRLGAQFRAAAVLPLPAGAAAAADADPFGAASALRRWRSMPWRCSCKALILAAGGQVWQSLAAMPLIVLTHILYGLGFWRGLFTTLKPRTQRAAVEVSWRRSRAVTRCATGMNESGLGKRHQGLRRPAAGQAIL